MTDWPRNASRLYYIGPAVAWAALIYFASAQPSSAYPKVEVPFADKLAHLVAYGVLGALTARATSGGRPIGWRQVALAWVIASAYGATDELHQLFSEGRSAEVLDWLMDAIGAAAGATAWKQWLGELLRHR